MGYLLLGMVFLMVGYGIYSIAGTVVAYFCTDVRALLKRYRPLAARHQNILTQYCAYYNLLTDEDKQRFQKEVQWFMYSKQFIVRGFKEVTDEMRVLISASAIQLTFGLPKIYLAHFDKILIYPDSYYSTITRTYHVGEVNPRMGMIILSWKSFIDGYADLTDSFNVGIHEMAHAIQFENRIQNEEFNFLDWQSLRRLKEITAREIPKIRSGDPHFFRSYAGTNGYEFFAVALEYFFEKPLEFRKAIPDLYSTLSQLLNQDPIVLYRLS